MTETHAELKQRLIALATATDMRFEATPDEEKTILALAAEVERQSPTAEPARRADLMDGRWRLLYSSFRVGRMATLARLAFNKLPAVEVRIEGIYQEVGLAAGHYNNLVHFSCNGVRGVQVVGGHCTVSDPVRMDIHFDRTRVIPADESLSLDALASALGVAPDALEAPLETEQMKLYSDVVYLDDDLRMMRGAYKNLYVLKRESAPTVSF